MPSGCLSGSVAGGCNVYTPTHFAMTKPAFLASGASSAWNPATRDTDVSTERDHLGVRVETRYSYVTRVFGVSRTVTDSSVMNLAPQ